MIEYRLLSMNRESCVDADKDDCEYVETRAELVADIPCGLQPNALFVVALTVLMTLVATVYICINIVFASSKQQSRSRAS